MGILMVTPVLLTLTHLLPKAFCRKLITIGLTHGWSETGFFCDHTSLQPAHSIKNPVSLVGVRKSCLNYSEVAIWLTLLLSVSWLVFCSQTVAASALYPLEYLLFPLIVWAALRWSPPGAIFAYSIVSYIAILGTLGGNGPFLVNTSATLSDRLTLMSVLPLQAFTGTIALSGYCQADAGSFFASRTSRRPRIGGSIAPSCYV